MPSSPAKTDPKTYSHFTPSDYPAYEFADDGTPHRVVPTSRGTKWTGPLTPFVNKYGYEMFGITRKDGVRRGVSRGAILKALGKEVTGHREPHDPFTKPTRKMMPQYPDYAVAKDGTVVRYQSPSRGRYHYPRAVAIVRGHYYLLDSIAGTRDYVKVADVRKLAGWV